MDTLRNEPLWIRRALAVVALVLLVLAAYWAVFNAAFLNYDDNEYVTENTMVRAGLSWQGVRWAFTTGHFASWLPVTWLSHMLDVEVFGLNPAFHHGVNLALHVLNTLLLLLLLNRLTNAFWPSWLVAAWFGLHPLHVESVAWIAERKDVLSTLFGLLAIMAYARYARWRSWPPYVASLALFALGLMSKPMLVTLPCLLLLLDYWPMNRLREDASFSWRALLRCVVEKLPFFALSAAASAITFAVQSQSGAMAPMERFPFPVRAANAIAAYGMYLAQTFWPAKLAVLYPHPGASITTTPVALSASCIAVVMAIALWQWRRRPFVIVGWLWFIGMLVPVIGLIQVGEQARADRYTYVPLVGIFIMIAWGVRSVTGPRLRRPAFALGIALTLALAARTQIQVRHWHDSVSLFKHAVAVTEDNYVAHTSLGSALLKIGELDDAMKHFDAAYRINPEFPEVLNNLGYLFLTQGSNEQALRFLSDAVARYPQYVEAHTNLGIALAGMGRFDDAVFHLRKALELRPGWPAAQFNLAMAYYAKGDTEAAVDAFAQAARISPEDNQARYMYAVTLAQADRTEESIAVLEALLAQAPNFEGARQLLKELRAHQDTQP